MRTDLVLDALRMAITRREQGADVELIHHSTPAVNTRASRSIRWSTTTRCSVRSGRSATPTTTPSRNPSSTRSRAELIPDHVGRTRSQLELAIVEYVGWFNDNRLHGALGDIPEAEFEQAYYRDQGGPLNTIKTKVGTN